MKKNIVILIAGMMSLSLMACGSSDVENEGASTEEASIIEEAPEEAETEEAETEEAETEDIADEATTETEEDVELANPVTEITEEEAASLVANCFSAPEGSTNVVWSRIEDGEYPLVQMSFELDGLEFTAREQVTLDEEKDISGMNYEWTVEDEGTLANWAGGAMPAKFYRFIGEDEYVDLCTWFDVEIGLSYSLGVADKNLDGFDIQAVAEALYDEDKQASASIPDEEEHVPMDITGCDTFTQIVDKLESESGYANATIGDTDVLLVTEYLYDYDGNETYAAIDADVYFYSEEGVPEYAGYVTAGGTAYPLTVADGTLYLGANHFVKKMTMYENLLVVDEEALVEYDT
nr:hypothetical protein [Butyrivibrio sp.]